jgi:hypothetical protein
MIQTVGHRGLLEVDLHRCGDNVGHGPCDLWEAV